MSTPRKYHHGDLRSALLEAALATVERDGLEGLSFRQLARIANVSPGAPYHHFRDKSELLAMLAKRGFEALQAELERSHEAGCDPKDCLHRLVEAYLGFARRSPKLYALLFIPEVGRPENLDLVEPDAMACFERLQGALAVVDPTATPRRYPRTRPHPMEFVARSRVAAGRRAAHTQAVPPGQRGPGRPLRDEAGAGLMAGERRAAPRPTHLADPPATVLTAVDAAGRRHTPATSGESPWCKRPPQRREPSATRR